MNADQQPVLKPCPFCGRPGQLSEEDVFEVYGHNKAYTVSCGKTHDDVMCFASITYDRDGDPNISFQTPEEAVEAWNTRSN